MSGAREEYINNQQPQRSGTYDPGYHQAGGQSGQLGNNPYEGSRGYQQHQPQQQQFQSGGYTNPPNPGFQDNMYQQQQPTAAQRAENKAKEKVLGGTYQAHNQPLPNAPGGYQNQSNNTAGGYQNQSNMPNYAGGGYDTNQNTSNYSSEPAGERYYDANMTNPGYSTHDSNRRGYETNPNNMGYQQTGGYQEPTTKQRLEAKVDHAKDRVMGRDHAYDMNQQAMPNTGRNYGDSTYPTNSTNADYSTNTGGYQQTGAYQQQPSTRERMEGKMDYAKDKMLGRNQGYDNTTGTYQDSNRQTDSNYPTNTSGGAYGDTSNSTSTDRDASNTTGAYNSTNNDPNQHHGSKMGLGEKVKHKVKQMFGKEDPNDPATAHSYDKHTDPHTSTRDPTYSSSTATTATGRDYNHP